MTWTRRLNPQGGRDNPRLLDGRAPSYQIFIEHVVPAPVPAGVTQVWQVVQCLRVTLDKDCKLSLKTYYIVDIVTLGGRATVPDSLGLIIREEDCIVFEFCQHTIGFDDQNSRYVQQTNVRVSEADALALKNKIAEPKTSFTTAYLFVRDGCCLEFKRFFASVAGFALPVGESLTVEGIGTFPRTAVPETPGGSEAPGNEGGAGGGQFFMNELTLPQAEAFHLALSRACAELGLKASYHGGLALWSGQGLAPLTQPSVWNVELQADRAGAEPPGLMESGGLLFRLRPRSFGTVAAAKGDFAMPLADAALGVSASELAGGARSFQDVLNRIGVDPNEFVARLRAAASLR